MSYINLNNNFADWQHYGLKRLGARSEVAIFCRFPTRAFLLAIIT